MKKVKNVRLNEFLNRDLEQNTEYVINKNKPIKWKIEDWLRNKGLDRHSRYVKSQYEKGITDDLNYKDTIGKCISNNGDKQYVRFFSVEGYSDFMELKENDEIDKSVECKVKKLINEGKVGYLDGDSFSCYLACRKDDYAEICKYLEVEYDTRDDEPNFYYNSLFDDFRMWFEDYCESNKGVKENVIYDVARYAIVNIRRYVDILLSAREYSDTQDDYWIDRLWNKAYSDMKNDR